MAFADNECEDFKKLSIYNLRCFLIARGITVSDSNRNNLVNLAQAASTMGLPTNVEYHDDELDLSERPTIKGVKLPDLFTIPEKEL